MTRRKLFQLLLIGVASLAAIASFGQTSTSAPLTAQPPAVTPVAAAPPAFEVSAVRLNKSGGSGSQSNYGNGRFTASNVSLKNVIEYQAYGIPEVRIVGGPGWLNSERFDIEAKSDSSVAEQLHTLGRDQRRLLMQGMFQQLLADRFKLVTHWETRELPIYALVVAKKGPTLYETKESEGGSHTSANSDGVAITLTAKGITLEGLARTLTQEASSELGRVVIDKTGIEGRYDVTLKWTPDTGATPMNKEPPPDSGPSIFTAIQEQLGLKLKSSKGPVQVLVIDDVEMPTQN